MLVEPLSGFLSVLVKVGEMTKFCGARTDAKLVGLMSTRIPMLAFDKLFILYVAWSCGVARC